MWSVELKSLTIKKRARGAATKPLAPRCARSSKDRLQAADISMMLAELGPVQTCIRLITSTTIPEGFTVLWEKRRLDLTAEAAVLSITIQVNKGLIEFHRENVSPRNTSDNVEDDAKHSNPLPAPTFRQIGQRGAL